MLTADGGRTWSRVNTGDRVVEQVFRSGDNDRWVVGTGRSQWYDTTVLPDVWRANVDLNLAAPACAPTHVPVVTPSNRPKGDAPPKLERRPLPPV